MRQDCSACTNPEWPSWLAAGLLSLDESGITDLARVAVRASFLDAEGQEALLGEIDQYAAGNGVTLRGA